MTNSKPHTALGKYVLRTPILSSDVLQNISSDKIKEICSDPVVSEAIFLSSPELHSEMQKYLLDSEDDHPKLERSLLKYISRMGYRCTPFGLFAGISVGKINGKTSIQLEQTDQYTRKTRLDMNYLCSMVQELEKIREIRSNLIYYPNNSLYTIGNRYRYVEYQYKNSVRHHYTIAIDASLYVDKVIKLAEKGAKIEALVSAIISDEISEEDAQNFIHNLIDNQILLSAIAPTVSGGDFLEHIYQKTGVSWLPEIKNKIQKLDQNLTNKDLKSYDEVVQLLEQLPVPFNKKFLFQTDLVTRTAANEVSQSTVNDIRKGIEVLNKLATRTKNQKLEQFKNAFYERYEDEEVPLSLALDVEAGIGYDQSQKAVFDICPLIDDMVLSRNYQNTGGQYRKYDLGKAESLIQQKFQEAKTQGRFEIEFTDQDLKDLDAKWDDLPTTFPVMCSILKKEEKTTIAIQDTGGPSASYLLGRFGHTGAEVKEILDEIVQKEAKEDRILAEIVHLPESRTGNILYRDHLRDYEIAYLAQSNLPVEQQIHISDLYISVQNGIIVLRSKKLNKVIEPKMGNAHSYEDTPLPIYQFLGDMQTQNLRSSVNFDWGMNLIDQTFYPRVRYKNIILSAARWRVNRKELQQLKDKASIAAWQEKYHIPSTFLVTDYDNELLIDLENEISREMFLAEIKNKGQILLKEDIYKEFDSVVKQGKQAYNNELIFAFHQ